MALYNIDVHCLYVLLERCKAYINPVIDPRPPPLPPSPFQVACVIFPCIWASFLTAPFSPRAKKRMRS